MATKVGEFFVDLVVDAASGNLSVKQLVGALGELDVASVTSVGIISKITETLWGMANAATETSVELSALHDVTGADPKVVQQWEKAAQRMHIHAGSIISAIRSVDKMMAGVAAGTQGPPAALTGILGLTPYKGTDAQGRPIMKSFIDLMQELANPKNEYWKRTADVQKTALANALPGVNADDAFRLLKEMRAGNFKPEQIQGLSDKQVQALTAVDRDWISVKQQVVDIFDKFILAGGAVDNILKGAEKLLEDVNRWIASNRGQDTMRLAGAAGADVLRRHFNPLTTGLDFGGFLGEKLSQKLFGSVLPPKMDPRELHGKLDINLMQNGRPAGSKTTYVKQGVTNADVWNVTDQIGVGGAGQ